MASITLFLVAISCFWQWIMLGWYVLVILYIVALFLLGILVTKFYIKSGRTVQGSVLSAAIFMVSIAPQANLPKMYFGIYPVIFAILGFRMAAIKSNAKIGFLILFIGIHIIKYFAALPIIEFVLPGVANFVFCFFAASGIDAILISKEELGNKIIRNAKFCCFTLVPIFYILLIYFYGVKRVFFFIANIFNIIALSLIFIFYLYYLTDRKRGGEPIYLRLFIAVMLESLTVSFLL